MFAAWSPHSARLVLLTILLGSAAPVMATEGVGEELGYRLFGEARKNKPLLLQNSRPTPVEVFDDARGVFMAIARYSDLELPCNGKQRLLKLRFRDSFRESVPFQVRIDCGRELQFVLPAQVAAPRAAVPATDAALAVTTGADTSAAGATAVEETPVDPAAAGPDAPAPP